MLMKLAPKKRRNPRNFYISIAATIVLACIGRYFSLSAEREKELQMGKLTDSLAQINSTLPRQVDAITTFDSIELSNANTIYYRYSVDLDIKNLRTQQKAQMEDRVRAGLEQMMCKEKPLLEAMRRFKIHQLHHYEADGRLLFNVEIYPDKLDCTGHKDHADASA
ncbi:hypothetical protein IAE35_12130 [Pseudomonas sp. S75]|uniref:hypothetical protein n=1 Tax=unclassified Pseudomonas TaxID=196821 RepID=UPI00190709B4|nr:MULTISPECIES: hypothetical protein [unclassified Pseudomonas]MBJ9977084.1 hypothetical protein [Pseudomonas sp. S30]MBK0154086.1 hypothetical protein [Pseudomonas sp. S75]